MEQAFYSTDRVMVISLHHRKLGYFPGTGDLKDVGEVPGRNYTLNVPFREGVSDNQYLDVFKFVIIRVMASFRPDCVVYQSGADSLAGDLLGTFNLSVRGHGGCLRFVKQFGLPMLVLGGHQLKT